MDDQIKKKVEPISQDEMKKIVCRAVDLIMTELGYDMETAIALLRSDIYWKNRF